MGFIFVFGWEDKDVGDRGRVRGYIDRYRGDRDRDRGG